MSCQTVQHSTIYWLRLIKRHKNHSMSISLPRKWYTISFHYICNVIVRFRPYLPSAIHPHNGYIFYWFYSHRAIHHSHILCFNQIILIIIKYLGLCDAVHIWNRILLVVKCVTMTCSDNCDKLWLHVLLIRYENECTNS